MASFATLGLSAVFAPVVSGCATFGAGQDAEDFTEFLSRVDKAQVQLQQGGPEPYKALWSKRDDITLAGGFGGRIEQGWTQVSKRLDWAGSNFVNGRNEIQRLAFCASGDVGYLVQTEHVVLKTPDALDAERNYRVTKMIRLKLFAMPMPMLTGCGPQVGPADTR